ncbi:GNAT family N-acetyltransferase [Pelagibacteraceae bacterium]|jgi:GNAT superfamily N-acetyltransferase|nr:GNAT family N-acetyltransferase [Pelagibacteraceae bacterium]
MVKVRRFFLEIKKKKKESLIFPPNIKISLDKEKDININKFFYRQVGKEHFWRDRLLWSDKEWNKYVSNNNLETGIMKINNNLVGFYEQEFHVLKNEIELIQMGILKEYQEKKFGSFLLKYIINKAFARKVNRVWVHTCTLDHKHALNNYLSKGFSVFKEEEINFTL